MGILRRNKSAYVVSNLLNASKLKNAKKLYEKYGLKKSVFSSISSNDFEGMDGEPPWLDRADSKAVLPNNKTFKKLSTNHQEALLNWSDNGYAILNNYYSDEEVDTINSELETIVSSGTAELRNNGNKIMFAINQSEKLAKTANKPLTSELMTMLLGKESKLFQSINFLHGSQQNAHSDSVHMTTFPLGYLTAIWIALEDIEEEQGALFHYPGSHKLPYVLNKNFEHGGNYFMLGKERNKNYENAIAGVISDNKLERQIFSAKKGDVLIWHANLLHGGLPITKEGSTRKSMVLHYYAEDVICYHEITQRPTVFK